MLSHSGDSCVAHKAVTEVVDYFDLGAHHRTVSTSSPEEQRWFDRGLNWAHAFNHEEAARCFERAIEHDPRCAMAYWGVAYAVGPNYNRAWDAFDPVDLATTLSKAFAASRARVTTRRCPCRRANSLAYQNLRSHLGSRFGPAVRILDC